MVLDLKGSEEALGLLMRHHPSSSMHTMRSVDVSFSLILFPPAEGRG